MCEICRKYACPPGCPNCFADANIRHCSGCGEVLSETDGYLEKNGIPYCRDCVLGESVGSFIRICGKNERKWLEDYGFLWIGGREHGGN